MEDTKGVISCCTPNKDRQEEFDDKTGVIRYRTLKDIQEELDYTKGEIRGSPLRKDKQKQFEDRKGITRDSTPTKGRQK